MRATRQLIGLALALGLAVCPATGGDLRDLHFGEALYHAYQGQYFDALQRLDTEVAMYRGLDQPELDTLHYHINDAEFSVGDFELDYRMHHRAGRAIKAVLEGAVDEAVRNEAAFRLARIHFQKGQLDDALNALARIKGTVPPQIRDDVEFLRANVYMATGRPSEAVKVLKQPRSHESLAGFVAYNLGIALLQDGRAQQAIEQLDKAGQLPAGDPAGLAIRDKSNLVLGTILFESGNFEAARQSLDRVHLDGPFSNQALLRAGSAEATAQHYDRALVPWNILVEREPPDAAVQQANRKSGCLHRQHPGRALSQGPDPRGEPAGRNLGHPPAQPARRARNLLPHGADGLSRLPDRAAQLPRPRGPAVETHGLEDQPRCFRLHHQATPRELRTAAAGSRCAVPGAGFADPPAPRAAQSPGRAPEGDPHSAAAGLSGDRGRADRRRAHCTHRKAAR